MATKQKKPESEIKNLKSVGVKPTITLKEISGPSVISVEDRVNSISISPQDLFARLSDSATSEAETKAPKLGLDEEVANIFRQASDHRNRLVDFFIYYTISLSVFVCSIILLQALSRMLIPGKDTVELIPQWALYLLVIGIFGQFIGLLTIVTKKVWTFEAFFKHADGKHSDDHVPDDDSAAKEK